MALTYIEPAQKLLGHLDKLAALKAGEKPAPINVEIDLSNRCSLGCEWCHFAFTHTRGPLAGKRDKPEGAIAGGDLMETSLALGLVRELTTLGASITWTGGGEPTLHPNFDDIVDYGARLGTKQAIYTHGGHITEERAALMKRAMTFVYVSLDASNAGQYKRDKGVNRFDAACKGISRLVAAKGDATVGVGYLVTELNWRSVDYAAELAQTLGADYIQFRPTINYTQDNPGEAAEDTGWLDEAIPFLERLADMWPKRVIVDLDRFRDYQTWRGHGYPTCYWSGLQTVVTPNGKVWTCVNKREHPDALIGNLTEHSFAEIWASRPLARVDGSCRIMCRGHIPNQALTDIYANRKHPEFV